MLYFTEVQAFIIHCLWTCFPETVLFEPGEADDRDQSKLEVKMWDPECPLTNKQIDQFLVVARYVYKLRCY